MTLARVLINLRFCKGGSLDVRFAPKATELLRRREMSRRANMRRHGQAKARGELLQFREQDLRRLQIRPVKSFREGAIDRRQQIARFAFARAIAQ
jgi:hypothetical protein